MSNGFLQFLGLSKRAGKLIEGYNKCEEFIQKKSAYLMIISIDASENTREKFEKYCKVKNIDLIQNYSSEELGAALGRQEIKVLCVTDKQIAEKLVALNGTVENNRG